MLAARGPLPSDDDRWAYEMKFDGIRAICYVEESLRLLSRNGNDITVAWPELAQLAPAEPHHVLDGEIVVFDHRGRPSFESLQPRMHQRHPGEINAMAAAAPATYVVFDLLHIGARPLVDLPYEQRRALLERIDPRGPHLRLSPRLHGHGADLLAESARLGLEGLIGKRLDGPYLPGRRSPLWTKIKNVDHQEGVIVGWKPGAGNRIGRIGSLVLAVTDAAGDLVYIGNVGTGFSRATLADLQARLAPLHRESAPLGKPPHIPGVIWVEPRLVGEVAFSEWTRDGILRHPTWRGLRPDKTPAQVVRERLD
ncbi:non-homologous end-joining DNA ligase [Nocardia sp. NEAU-351]|uniref:DNA ligase (ATP) n=2 Tax=Nocardia bovistercoris TaxID=2785916 RepID=A0A931IFI8_9NOCA|nr:non-homologous end-joining DNA ligase [Nocardia bovistercoris]MBH0779506.1 non-homologous end-joining DNA ligase [Nocardia bovistercoris]